ncbi:hypothetical protein NX059_010536 [Plenodomus lindquistii]|nr:hypothetical protein NX059_010536 [Plenodomus lindquistii]
MRREVQNIFADEIRTTYEALEFASFSTAPVLQNANVKTEIQQLCKMVVRGRVAADGHLNPTDDFFELGMDSLQATQLVRLLNSALRNIPCKRLTGAFVYQKPSVSKLTEAVSSIIRGELHNGVHKLDRGSQMQSLAKEYIRALDCGTMYLDSATVVMTGSTGNLGAHMLGCLVRSPRVCHIVSWIRSNSSDVEDLRSRQMKINAAAEVGLSSQEWHKISFLAINIQTANMGLAAEQLSWLSKTMTHIVHLAWPMDFNRQLNSFRHHLNALKTLICLARSAYRIHPHITPRVMMASSISVARHFGDPVVPEKPLDDPLVTTAMGYAEAKWVCEQMLLSVGETHRRQCQPMIVRIGQLSGPEWENGLWKTEEHIPALIKASQLVSGFPDLQREFSWIPVDRASKVLMDLLFQEGPAVESIYHLENPIRQPFSDLGAIVVEELKLKDKCIPFDAWLQRLKTIRFANSLKSFFENDFLALATGNVALDTSKSRAISACLRSSGGISQELIVEYIKRWRLAPYLL